ncbi:type I glyceraldehyde-3-phosphate dehydrogenase [bacterium]|nr:type I glyceraldehyde-3-phosphate dehydrogenase [bacterium]
MRIAINGFGRIGRIVTRNLFQNAHFREKIELVALNDVGNPTESAFLIKRDSLYGTLDFDVSATDHSINIGGQEVIALQERDPNKLDWGKLGVDVVLECTGRFTSKEAASVHIKNGAKKVLVSAPGKGVDATIVMGVNHESYNHDSHHVISNASCTTNCLAPMASVLHKEFGIVKGLMTTIHSYTSDQRLLDNTHSDPRRARAAALNMIPTTTGAARAVGLVIPDLAGKLDGFAIRVPTPNVSMTDLVAEIKKPASKEEINQALKAAATSSLKGILDVSDEPLVSSDYVGSRFSSVVDSALTTVISDSGDKGSLVKVCSWYDNETGFSNRMLDLCMLIASKL